MRKRFFILLAFGVCLTLAGRNSAKPASPAPETAAESSAPRIYVTNEVSGDLSVIDSGTRKVIATVPLGKRPRGIHTSADQKTLYVALSGSPISGPEVDESTRRPTRTQTVSEVSMSRRTRWFAFFPEGQIRRTLMSAKTANSFLFRMKTCRR
jgi:YVTN family beta-propeller protein